MYSNGGIYIPDRKPPMGAVRNPHLLINKGLVGDWMMWESAGPTVEDLSGNGNHGTFVNNTAWTVGNFGHRVTLDGTDDSILISKSLTALYTTAYSISIWVDTSDVDADIVTDLEADPWPFMLRYLDGSIEIWIDLNKKIDVVTTTSGLIHLIVTHQGEGDLILYKNGENIGSAATIALPSAGQNIRLGNSVGSAQDLAGDLDVFSIYNRVLNPSEVALLYREPFCGFRWTSIIELASYVAAVGGIPIFRRRRAG